MELLQGILGSAVGFFCYNILYSSKERKAIIPQIKFRRIEISPHFLLHFKRRSIHIHHWMSYPVILVFLLNITSAFSDLILVKTFLIGATIQGISAKDRFRILVEKT